MAGDPALKVLHYLQNKLPVPWLDVQGSPVSIRQILEYALGLPPWSLSLPSLTTLTFPFLSSSKFNVGQRVTSHSFERGQPG